MLSLTRLNQWSSSRWLVGVGDGAIGLAGSALVEVVQVLNSLTVISTLEVKYFLDQTLDKRNAL